MPHLLVQRGENSRQVFFSADDYKCYLDLVKENCDKWDVDVLAYCLMPNRVHFLLTPNNEKGLARALGDAHRRYAIHINRRYGRSGKLWHARFDSCTLEKSTWLHRAARYVERDPVDNGLLPGVLDFPWTSAHSRITGDDTSLIKVGQLGELEKDWENFISTPNDEADQRLLVGHERRGRPLGSKEFILGLEEVLGKRLRPRKRGRKPKIQQNLEELAVLGDTQAVCAEESPLI
jgi:putative transposase